ncbi:Mg(2+) transport ATPase, P-type [Spiroplasma sp. NBRC 100390]|uniref:magnesium-translocating P-type ATPase n=1 Tax=unclassified Spiroplasma TaxID=2637901 RepID=UPI0008929F7F|nr:MULTISPECIES: magnesium-translocating P-type ATPase [unclassified Spiroplasma]AOX44264.1 Mg(2+) transport ATPase, P-type [Spiroplasma sp. TU-14]APE13734.1 Mg(2+) transport ATPase, P-type [Spiroplasma sp. NBRC 100390]
MAKIITKFKGDNKDFKGRKKEIGFLKTDEIKQISQFSQTEILEHFDLKNFGLDYDEAKEMGKKYGDNSQQKTKFHWFKHFLKVLLNPFNIVLAAIATYNLVSYFTLGGDSFEVIGVIIIAIMIIISTTIAYIQDIRSFLVTKKLTDLVSNTITVIRLEHDEKVAEVSVNNNTSLIREAKELEIHELVQGDLIYLSSGDMVPADVRVLWSNDLFINQSSLTGESMPIEKHASYNPHKPSLLELENICYTGTSVISGSAIAIVVGVGQDTYYATISKTLQVKPPENSFNRGIKRTTWLLLSFMFVMVPIVFVINGVTKNDWLTALLFAISVAVGLTPEMLPMIVTSNLARGASRMSKAKVVVKKLEAIQNLGAIDVLCTDKTGTLTNDKIELVDYQLLDKKKDDRLLTYLYLNSYFQTGLKNPMDKAIIHYIDEHHLSNFKNNYQKIDEIPFDFNRRKLTVVVRGKDEHHTLICKGAIEEIVKNCTKIEYNGQVEDLTEEHLRMINATTERMNSQGLRVVGLAYSHGHDADTYYSSADEKDLIFYGFASFLDKPKPSAAKMIQLLRKNGVQLKILTGDNEQVTRAICDRVHLKIKGVVTGDYIEKLSEFELRDVVEQNNVFVKLNPLQKAKIITALKQNKHIVGFMGDGINDAPVLRQSDVAISVDNATDIAKEASDIILLEKSLLVLEKGIVQGRQIFGNILKYIKITIASNFGNVLSILVASAWLPFQPMMPIQILFQNLLYDMSQLAVAFDKVDADFLSKPQTWTTKDILPFVFINGPVSSIFDILTFVVMGYYFGVLSNPQHITAEQVTLFQTGWFVEGLVTQTLIVQLYRTRKIPFFQSMSSWQLLVAGAAVIAVGIALPYTSLGPQLSLAPLPAMYFAWFALLVGGYCFMSQGVKVLYIKIFKRWL